MLTNFVGQEFKQDIVETVHLCSMMSAVLAGNMWKAGVTWGVGGCNHLEVSSLTSDPGLKNGIADQRTSLWPLHVAKTSSHSLATGFQKGAHGRVLEESSRSYMSFHYLPSQVISLPLSLLIEIVWSPARFKERGKTLLLEERTVKNLGYPILKPSFYLIGLLWRLNELLHTKHLEQSLAHCQCHYAKAFIIIYRTEFLWERFLSETKAEFGTMFKEWPQVGICRVGGWTHLKGGLAHSDKTCLLGCSFRASCHLPFPGSVEPRYIWGHQKQFNTVGSSLSCRGDASAWACPWRVTQRCA